MDRQPGSRLSSSRDWRRKRLQEGDGPTVGGKSQGKKKMKIRCFANPTKLAAIKPEHSERSAALSRSSSTCSAPSSSSLACGAAEARSPPHLLASSPYRLSSASSAASSSSPLSSACLGSGYPLQHLSTMRIIPSQEYLDAFGITPACKSPRRSLDVSPTYEEYPRRLSATLQAGEFSPLLHHDTAWDFALSGTEETSRHPIIGDWCGEALPTGHEDRSDREKSTTPCLVSSPGSTGASTELSDVWMDSCRSFEEDLQTAAAVPLGCDVATGPSTANNSWFNAAEKMGGGHADPIPAFTMDLETEYFGFLSTSIIQHASTKPITSSKDRISILESPDGQGADLSNVITP